MTKEKVIRIYLLWMGGLQIFQGAHKYFEIFVGGAHKYFEIFVGGAHKYFEIFVGGPTNISKYL